MKNYVMSGDTINVVVPASTVVESGEIVYVGDVPGVSLKRGITGETIAIKTGEVYTVGKAAGAIAQGTKLYYDPATKQATPTAGSLKYLGFAFSPALSADVVVEVRFARL